MALSDRELLEGILTGQVILMANLMREEIAQRDPARKTTMSEFIPESVKALKLQKPRILELFLSDSAAPEESNK